MYIFSVQLSMAHLGTTHRRPFGVDNEALIFLHRIPIGYHEVWCISLNGNRRRLDCSSSPTVQFQCGLRCI